MSTQSKPSDCRRVETIDGRMHLFTRCDQCTLEFSKRCQSKHMKQRLHFCSRTCLNESQRAGLAKAAKEEHFLGRYGVKNPFSARGVIEARRETFIQRYGVDNPSKIPEVAAKKSVSMKRACRDTDVLERRESTMQARYGMSWLATPAARSALREHSIRTLGVDHPMKSHEVIRARAERFCEKHGVDNPRQLPGVDAKIKETCTQRYGVSCVLQRPDLIEKCTAARLRNASVLTSEAELRVLRFLREHFGEVEHQVPIFYREGAFWLVDFRLAASNVYVQFDGVYWHGLEKTREELIERARSGDAVAAMQLKARQRDHYQDAWFKHSGLTLVRIREGTSQDAILDLLKEYVRVS